MNLRHLVIITLFFTPVAGLTPTHAADSNPSGGVIFSTDLGGNELQFLNQAAAQGVMQANLGELIAGHAQSSEVKALAQTLAEQIGSQNEAVRLVAIKKGLTVPSSPNSRQKATLNKLAALDGLKFDKGSMLEMVQEQQDYVDLFEKGTLSQDTDIHALAVKLLPEVKQQLSLLRKLTGAAPRTGSATNFRANQ
jgi:putative membrane protein